MRVYLFYHGQKNGHGTKRKLYAVEKKNTHAHKKNRPLRSCFVMLAVNVPRHQVMIKGSQSLTYLYKKKTMRKGKPIPFQNTSWKLCTQPPLKFHKQTRLHLPARGWEI